MTTPDPIQEEVAMLFAGDEKAEAISFLLGHLEKNPKDSSSTLWLMLMEIYQASQDRASFERLASIYAQRFQSSPPSWVEPQTESPVRLGRNVLVLDGAPSEVSPSRWRDFLLSAREAKFCRLDFSRVRLPDGQAGFETDADALIQLMDRLNRQQTKVLLMGDGALQERLSRDLESWPVGPARKSAMRLLLGILQWRGQAEAFEALAMTFADEFETSPPGYEKNHVLAQADPDPTSVQRVRVVDEENVEAWCEELLATYRTTGFVEKDFRDIERVSYPAALHMSRFFEDQGLGHQRLIFRGVNHLLRALFDTAGVSALITYARRQGVR